MRHRMLVLALLAWSAQANDACPTPFPSLIQSAALAVSSTTHRILLKESNGTYTAVEAANAPPYGVVRTIPDFAKQLSACFPPEMGLYPFTVSAAAQLASGGYLLAILQSPPVILPATQVEIAVFDAGLNLVSEAPLNSPPFTDIVPLAFADVNGDGIPDLIGWAFQGEYQAWLTVSLGTGGVDFGTPTGIPLGAPFAPTAIAVADVNGDHKPDIIFAAGLAGLGIALGNGDGTFQAPVVIDSSVESAVALAVADLNGDGKPDLVFTTNDPTTAVQVAFGNGNGTFATPTSYPVEDAESVAIGDVNGDGIPDIVTDGISVLFGDGKGGFPSRRDCEAAQGSVILTDFNGDGIVDIVLRGSRQSGHYYGRFGHGRVRFGQREILSADDQYSAELRRHRYGGDLLSRCGSKW